MKQCPFCAEQIQDDALVCRFCNRDLTAKKAKKPLSRVVLVVACALVGLGVIGGGGYYVSRVIGAHMGPQGVVRAYLDAPPGGEKYAFICHAPQISKADLAAYYKDTKEPARDIETKIERQPNDNSVWVSASWVYGADNRKESSSYWVEKHGGEWCVDWVSESRLLGNLHDNWEGKSKSVPAFVRAGPLTDYYNFAFSHAKNTHYAFKLRDQDATGYLARAEPNADKVYEAMKSGSGYILLKCELSYPDRDSKDVIEVSRASVIDYEPVAPPSAVTGTLPSTPPSTPSATSPYECPRLATCCSDPKAPDTVQFTCVSMRMHEGYNDCDKDVAGVLRIYDDKTLNPKKAKPPAGCR